MELANKVIVITGAAGGIGRAMANRFAQEVPDKIICVDLDLAGAQTTADRVGGVALKVNVAVEAEIAALIETVETTIGPIDLLVQMPASVLTAVSRCQMTTGKGSGKSTLWRMSGRRAIWYRG